MNKAKQKKTANIGVNCDPRLKQLAMEAAEREETSLSELSAKALARYLRVPELAKVPRSRMGRPPKEIRVNGKISA